jgi:hypothetical protein
LDWTWTQCLKFQRILCRSTNLLPILQTLGIPLEALAMADSNQPGLEAQRKQAGMTKEAPPTAPTAGVSGRSHAR